jgi:hypothetical protein
MSNNHLISDTITDLKSQEVLNLRLSIHKSYRYGKSIWNFHMDMDIWITYGYGHMDYVWPYGNKFGLRPQHHLPGLGLAIYQ